MNTQATQCVVYRLDLLFSASICCLSPRFVVYCPNQSGTLVKNGRFFQKEIEYFVVAIHMNSGLTFDYIFKLIYKTRKEHL